MTVAVKGLQEVQRFLEQLPEKLQNNVMRGAMRAAAKVVAEEARALAPVSPPNKKNATLYKAHAGSLRDSIRFDSLIDGSRVIGYVRAGPSKNEKNTKNEAAFTVFWVEYGTAAHWIKVKDEARGGVSVRKLNEKAKAGSLKIGQNFIGQSVLHPGAKPRPFMTPALDHKREEATQAAAAYIRHRLSTKHGIDAADEGVQE